MQLYFVRHGSTEFNVGKTRFRGQLDIPLSEDGTKQAKAIGLALKTIPLDIIYSSELKRAKITAKMIKQYHPKAELVEEPFLSL